MQVKKTLIFIVIAMLTVVLGLQLFMFSSYKSGSDNSDNRYFMQSRQNYKIFQPYIPDSLSFAGEIVPIDHLIVRERLERELLAIMYWHSHTIYMLKRSGRFFPIIEPILQAEGIHNDFKFLAMAESELANVVSPAGAAGFWQFLKKTGQEYGLEVGTDVDERYHLEKSTRAACQYIKTAKSMFGSYTLAAASYNMGTGALQQQVSAQKTKDYYQLFLNEETSRYLYRIVALKLIWSQPLTYGFFIRNKDIYQPIEVTYKEVNTEIPDLTAWALDNKISYLELRYLNPWLRTNRLPMIVGKTYQLAVPINMSQKQSVEKIEEPNQIFNDSIKVE
jgi:hypothetical protein